MTIEVGKKYRGTWVTSSSSSCWIAILRIYTVKFAGVDVAMVKFAKAYWLPRFLWNFSKKSGTCTATSLIENFEREKHSERDLFTFTYTKDTK